jgi:uncharacterized protein YdeI (YjbR/CyaY-like superfamily)
MGTHANTPLRDGRVDAYIANSADFARPILEHLRRIVRAACPDAEETIKWGHPTFMQKGMLCGMAAFKQHCSLGFWKHALIFGRNATGGETAKEAMGQFGRITSLSDLPSDQVLLAYVKEAVRLNDLGIKTPSPARKPKKLKPTIPADLNAALQGNRLALQKFKDFSPSHQREYIEWLTEAKREETRLKRLKTAIDWLAQGKPRHWKYMNC